MEKAEQKHAYIYITRKTQIYVPENIYVRDFFDYKLRLWYWT